MTDVKPRKTLSLKRKVKTESKEAEIANEGNRPPAHTGDEVKESVRGRKRVIKMQSMAQKKAVKDSKLSPSERQSRELKRILAETFSVWRRRRPLALGIDAQISDFLNSRKQIRYAMTIEQDAPWSIGSSFGSSSCGVNQLRFRIIDR